MLRWHTSWEDGLTGFQVWRALSADGPYKPVSGVIPASNSDTGSEYKWLDTTVDTAGSYWYKVQSLPDGAFFGPTSTRPEPNGSGAIQLYMPLVQR